MICDNCKKRESVISFTKVENNEVTEIHLCKECAAKKFKGNFLMIDGFKDLFKEIFNVEEETIDEEKTCRFCGRKIREVLKTSDLGCIHCYDEFRDEINNFLQNYQFSSVHKGKIPVSSPTDLKVGRKILDLKDKLQEALILENYEEAAILRDEIKDLEVKNDTL